MLDLTEAINSIISVNHMEEDVVLNLVKDMLTSAYKRKFGTDENVSIKFFPDETGKMRKVEVYSVKEVVEEENWYDAVKQIPLDDARELAEDVDVGDYLEIPIDPSTFEYSAVQSAKQRSQQVVKEYNTDRIYMEAKAMEGKLVYGVIKRNQKHNASDYLVDLNLKEKDGGMEQDALFPLRGQSPRETYTEGTRYKFFVEKVDKGEDTQRRGRDGRMQTRKGGVRIILTRASKEFVKALIENEVPEISSGDVEIVSIARQAGIRTKIAVDTKKADLDPVGATVGKSGSRIQTVMAECEGEKIDIIRYSSDPLAFIANSLIPAQVRRVVTIDPHTKHVVAIVDDSQLGIAIGQGGVNVKLAKALTDWNIEVKTQAQFNEMEETLEIYRNVDDLFKPEAEEAAPEEHALTNEDIGIDPDDTPLTDIGLPEKLVRKLHDVDIWSIQEFFEYPDQELLEMGITQEEIDQVKDSVVITEEGDEEEFECPVCHQMLAAGTTVCPNCGAEFEFE